MNTMASQITSLTIVYSIVYSDADQRKHQSSASLAFVWGIQRGSMNSPHKWPVTRKMFPFKWRYHGTMFFNCWWGVGSHYKACDVIARPHLINIVGYLALEGLYIGTHRQYVWPSAATVLTKYGSTHTLLNLYMGISDYFPIIRLKPVSLSLNTYRFICTNMHMW